MKTLPKKYCLHPGYITSIEDGQRHFIDAPNLAQLYGIVWHTARIQYRHDLSHPEGYICLYPQFDGNYKLEGE